MSLRLHHGNRLEVLAEHLARELRTPAGGVLEREVLVVQHVGMARWLALQLAQRNGICAGVAFRSPAAFVWDVLRALRPELPDVSPFAPETLTWRLVALLDTLQHDARFAAVQAWLAAGRSGADPHRRRFDLAQRLAQLLHQYLVHRPQWLLAWEQGDAPDDWQAELWRCVVAQTGPLHRARLQAEALAVLRRAGAAALPVRTCVFGIPSLPPADLDLLAALAAHRDVHLFLLNPCAEYATHIRTRRTIERLAGDRDPDELLLEEGNPLLASMGRQPIELLERVMDLDGDLEPCFAEPDGSGMLATVQADVLHLRRRGADARADAPPVPVAPDDASIQLHVCHSPMREVEILYDHLLALFDTTALQPSQVVVMTPDVERYAPCFEAVRAAAPEGRRIPFTIADVGFRAEQPLVQAFLALLELPASRFEVDRLLALLETPPVRRRFGLDASDVEQVAAWVRDAGVRWGIDGAARAAEGLPATAEHTWRFGLDRLLLGYALPGAGDGLFAGVLPFDDVEGSRARALGALAAFEAAAVEAAAHLAAPRPVAAWAADLRALLDRFCDPGDDEEDAAVAVRDALTALAESAAHAAFTDDVSRDVVAAHLGAALAERSPGGRFLAGSVTVCALTPMRSVPFEVVCLLGMDVGSFPRSGRPPGFDRMAERRLPGDRSTRDDDRTLFLEALLSARVRLHVSWVGRSIRDNGEIPPSVLVSELLDYLERAFVPPPGVRRMRDHVVVTHRLQPFSRRYFDGSVPALFSYADELCRAIASADAAGGQPSRPLLEGRLEELGAEWRTTTLDALVRSLQNPSRTLLSTRLGLRVAEAHELPEPREPFALDALERHGLDRALLALRLDDRPLDEATAVLRARGALPHGALGESVVRERLRDVDALAGRLRAALPRPTPEPVRVAIALGAFRLEGALHDVGPDGRVAWRVGKLRGRDLLDLWVRHLVLQLVAPPGVTPRSRWIGQEEEVALQPVAPADARDALVALVQHHWEALHRLVRLFPDTARAWVAATRDADAAARACWEGGEHQRGEGQNPWHRLAWRDVLPLDGEFPVLAQAVFAPLLAAAEVSRP